MGAISGDWEDEMTFRVGDDADGGTVTLTKDDLPKVESAITEARRAMATTSGEFRAIIKRVVFVDPNDPEKQPTTTITLVVEGRSAVEIAGNLSRFGARTVTVSLRGYAEQLKLWDEDEGR